MDLPLTREELHQLQEDQNRETIAKIRFWWLRPDGIVFRPPTEKTVRVFESAFWNSSEFKRMSDVTDQYLLRARFRAENQYESLRRALGIVLQRQGWKVEQITFIV
jgi:hypothetical protein